MNFEIKRVEKQPSTIQIQAPPQQAQPKAPTQPQQPHKLTVEELKEAFALIDKNGDGSIDRKYTTFIALICISNTTTNK